MRTRRSIAVLEGHIQLKPRAGSATDDEPREIAPVVARCRLCQADATCVPVDHALFAVGAHGRRVAVAVVRVPCRDRYSSAVHDRNEYR